MSLGMRLPAIKVEALKTNSKYVKICQAAEKSLSFSETRRFSCLPGVKGSIVRITSTGREAIGLSLCEVQVFGVSGKIIMSFI